MTVPEIVAITDLLTALQADPERRFVMEHGPRVAEPAYGLYELPADPQGVHELVADVAADSPAFVMLRQAADEMLTVVPTGEGLPPLTLEPLAQIFTLAAR